MGAITDKLPKLIPDSKKLQAYYVGLLAIVVLGAFGKIPGGELAYAIVGLAGLFFGANVGEHWTKKGKLAEPATHE